MSLTAAQKAAADNAVAEVRRTFVVARAVTLGAELAPAVPGLGTFLGLFSGEATASIRKQVQDQNARAENWATVERSQAERGSLDFDTWLGFGDTYASFAAGAAGDVYDASLFRALLSTAKKSAGDVAKIPQPNLWPDWVKWAVGATAVVVVLAVALPYARAFGVVK